MINIKNIIHPFNHNKKIKTHEKKKQKSSYSLKSYLLCQQRRNPSITNDYIEEFIVIKTENYYLDKLN